MTFGLKRPQAGNFTDIVKYDARSGHLFRVDYDRNTRSKVQVDITVPAPRFAVDFGSISIGYIKYSATGPDFKLVPEGSVIPDQPEDLDDQNRPAYRAGFKLKLFGRVLDGLREFSSTASCVVESIEELYDRFKVAPEAAAFRIPVVELTSTTPITIAGWASVTYKPNFTIVGWAERVAEMGARTVPAPIRQATATPQASPPVPAPKTIPPVTSTKANSDLDDEIPF